MTGDATSASAGPSRPRGSHPWPDSDRSLTGQPTAADRGTPRNLGASDPAVALHPGLIVGRDARYELVSKIGAGGMGEVWKARDVELGRDVAIKRILGHASLAMRARFQRETQAATKLRHPNIVTVFDAGEDAFGMYMVMEFVPGQTLAQLLHKGPLPQHKAVSICMGVCRGAAHAHKRGAVHRDIKPSNIMLDDDGTPRLIDFGLVRMEGASDLSLTTSGMGTFDYAAPEQKQDASLADARSDVYALGVVFYEMLTGLRPPVTPRRVPAAWRDLIERASDGVAADRHANAEELLAEIETILAVAAPQGESGQLIAAADDLRCPSCRLLNALEAKLCRKCGTSLRGACPACNETIRLGLQRCDQCFANVGYVVKLRDGIEALRGLIREARLQEAATAADSLRAIAESGHLGPAASLLPAWSEQLQELDQRLGAAGSEAKDAESALRNHDFELAEQHWRRLATLDRGDEARERSWRSGWDAATAAQAEEMAAVQAALARLQSDLDAGRLEVAEEGLAKLLAGFDAAPRRWHADWAQKAVDLRRAVQRRRDKAIRLVRDADARLAMWEDEHAVVALQAAAKHDVAHAARSSAADAARPARLARRAAALAVLRAQVQSILARVEARDLLAAQAEFAAIDQGDWTVSAPQWLASREPARLRSDGDLAIAALAQEFAAAERLAADADLRLAEREDEAAIWLLQQAAELRPEYATKLATVRGASDARIAARDAARAEYLSNVDGMRAALDARWLGQANSWGRHLERQSKEVGSAWWALQAEDLDRLREQERQLADSVKADSLRRRRRSGAWLAAAALAVCGWIVVSARIHTEASIAERKRLADAKAVQERLVAAAVERERSEEAAIRERRDVAAKAALAAELQSVDDALTAGDIKALFAVQKLASKMPLDARLLALRTSAEELGSRCLAQSLLSLGLRLERNDPSALTEWLALRAWYGDDARLEPLRRRGEAAHAAARVTKLQRAGLVAGSSGGVDFASGLPRRVVHLATQVELALVPTGEFAMGSPPNEPQRDSDETPHRRLIEKPFYLGVTEVTQAQFRKVMAGNPSRFLGDELPVDSVGWNDCQSFLQAVGSGLRLPSEAEWEYACRAGAGTPFSFGATITTDQVNCDGQVPYGVTPVGRYRAQTVRAGSLPANAWGLHEMHGNVWEWCQDGYDVYPASGTGDAAPAARARVARGGSWDSSANYCRSACRGGFESGLRFNRIGFRLARDVPE